MYKCGSWSNQHQWMQFSFALGTGCIRCSCAIPAPFLSPFPSHLPPPVFQFSLSPFTGVHVFAELITFSLTNIAALSQSWLAGRIYYIIHTYEAVQVKASEIFILQVKNRLEFSIRRDLREQVMKLMYSNHSKPRNNKSFHNMIMISFRSKCSTFEGPKWISKKLY